MQSEYVLGHSPLGFHTIAYTQWGEPNNQPPVICVHGLTRNGRDFDRLAHSLQASRQVFCPDIVGRGASGDLADASLYAYPQYLADMTVLIARTGTQTVDWVGTSMGGIIGMLLAAQPNAPIRRLVINDVGPFIPLAALKRIADYAATPPTFTSLAETEQFMRKIYASFGQLSDADWRQMAEHGTRPLPDGKLTLAYDPKIMKNFATLDKDVEFWEIYDRIACPTLVLRGATSDILLPAVAQEMTLRGPRAKLIEILATGHAPALVDPAQIDLIKTFLES